MPNNVLCIPSRHVGRSPAEIFSGAVWPRLRVYVSSIVVEYLPSPGQYGSLSPDDEDNNNTYGVHYGAPTVHSVFCLPLFRLDRVVSIQKKRHDGWCIILPVLACNHAAGNDVRLSEALKAILS